MSVTDYATLLPVDPATMVAAHFYEALAENTGFDPLYERDQRLADAVAAETVPGTALVLAGGTGKSTLLMSAAAAYAAEARARLGHPITVAQVEYAEIVDPCAQTRAAVAQFLATEDTTA